MLQQFTLNIYSSTFQNLLNDHALENIDGVYVLITKKYYNENSGLDVFTDDNKNNECVLL